MLRCLSVAVLGVLAALSAAAQESPQPEDEAQEPVLTRDETIYVRELAEALPSSAVVAHRLELPLLTTPASISVVGEDVILEQHGLTLNDAMENVSGANVQTTSGVHDLFVLRGYDSLAAGLVLTDGAPEPEATFYQLYNVESVEVLKGPATYLYGGNPLAGTVNLRRKEAVRQGLLEGRLSIGSFDARRLSVDYNSAASDRRLGFRFNGLVDESSHYRDDKSSQSVGLNPALTWWIDDRRVLRLNVELLRNDYAPDAGIPVAGGEVLRVPRRRSYQSPFDFSDQDLLRLRIDYEAALGAAWTLRNKLYFTELDWLTDGTVFGGLAPAPGGPLLIRSLVGLVNEQRLLGNQLEGIRRGARHRTLFGVEALRATDDFMISVGALPVIDPFSPLETAAVRPPAIPFFGQRGNVQSVVVAPYVLDHLTVGERFHLTYGGRFDVLDYEDSASTTLREEEELSPVLGLLYSLTPRLSLYANASRGFAPPPSRVAGERRPEESEQIELGLKGNLRSLGLVVNLALYRLDRENVAIFDDLGATAQQGSQRSEGFELEIAASPGPRWRYQVAYAWTDARLTRFNEQVQIGFSPAGVPLFAIFDRSGNRATFAPEHTLNFWLVRRFGRGFSVGGGGRYLGEQFIGEDNAFAIEESMVFNAMIAYSRRGWQLGLNVDNLFDEVYDTRGFGATSIIPAPSTAVHLSLALRR